MLYIEHLRSVLGPIQAWHGPYKCKVMCKPSGDFTKYVRSSATSRGPYKVCKVSSRDLVLCKVSFGYRTLRKTLEWFSKSHILTMVENSC